MVDVETTLGGSMPILIAIVLKTFIVTATGVGLGVETEDLLTNPDFRHEVPNAQP